MNCWEDRKHADVSLWTVVSTSPGTGIIWLRSGNQPNSYAYSALLPGLDEIEHDEAEEATDVVNALFGPDEVLQFLRFLLCDSRLALQHRIVSINHRGMRGTLRRAWKGKVVHDLHPFGSMDPFSVLGVESTSGMMMAIEGFWSDAN
jgi:hypothetical protein